eukprot:scaffold49543_cov52-Phaeocystis_antarctica.AAC.2
MLKVSPWQRRSSAPAPPHGTSGRSGWLGEAGPLGAQPLPRVLELAAPKAAHSPAFLTTQVQAIYGAMGESVPHDPAAPPAAAEGGGEEVLDEQIDEADDDDE